MRLHENVYAEGFVGLTKLNYNLTPAVAVSGAFDAWRIFLGGALSGVWHDGNWRFQPSILGAWGSETQNAYTDSAGTAVASQTITFGRIAAGPEIGYTFKDESRGWTFEPFVLLKGNIDFSSAPVYSIAGTPFVVRSGSQASGQLGGGLAMQLDDGFYLRVQASYDSLFVSGLDAWTGRLRAGKTF
jgi:outer membrane autotransporter protein